MTQPRSVLSRELLPASIAVFATSMLASFQALGIAAALPDIATDLGNVTLLPWSITVFLMASSLATVAAGPFIDAIGVSRMFRLAVTVFIVTGFATAFSPSMEVLIGLRLFQGIGAGLILSTGASAITLIYPEHLVGRAFAANATVWGIMGVAGPAIAAAVLTFLTWEWIFYLNLPLGLIALAAGWRVMPGPFGDRNVRFDFSGVALLAVLAVAALLAVDSLDWSSLIWIAIAGVALTGYIAHARRSTSPVVRLEHITPQPYRGLALSTALILTGAFAMSTYTPLYVRAGLEGSAALTAWSVLPLTVGWTVGALISSRLADRNPESWIILLGFSVAIPSLILSWLVVVLGFPLMVAFAFFFTAGLGVGMSTNASLTLLRSTTVSAQMGRVVSAHLFIRNQGFTFGAAIGGAVLFLVVAMQLGDPDLVRELIDSPEGGGPPGAAAAVRSGFAAAIAAGLGATLLGLVAAVRMRRFLTDARDARDARGHPR